MESFSGNRTDRPCRGCKRLPPGRRTEVGTGEASGIDKIVTYLERLWTAPRALNPKYRTYRDGERLRPVLITALMVDERWIVARLQGGAHYYMENPWGWSEELESLCTHDPGLIITWLGIDAVLVEEKKRDRNFQLYTGSRGLMVFDQLVRRQFKPNITS